MYNNPTHNPYHSPYQAPYQSPYYGIPEQYMDVYEDRRRLMEMYPDMYRRLYPRVQELCGHMDVYTNPRMYPYVDSTLIEEMTDQIYRMYGPEIFSEEVESEQFTARGIFRNLITILIIRELLDRRHRRFPYRGYGGFPY